MDRAARCISPPKEEQDSAYKKQGEEFSRERPRQRSQARISFFLCACNFQGGQKSENCISTGILVTVFSASARVNGEAESDVVLYRCPGKGFISI